MGRTRRRKKHTQVGVESDGQSVPKTFVMERGKVGSVLNQLVLDLRQVMEPYTASKLKVRQRNTLKDFIQVAGPLGVSHFVMVSRTGQFVNLRICHLPHGPTLSFHVNTFCLSREVLANVKKPVSSSTYYQTPPMVILNGFSSTDKPAKLMSTMLQNMFPPISVTTVKLADIKRCVLFQYDCSTNILEIRHYAIQVVARGISRGVKKLNHSHVPDLSRYNDISDYLTGGYASESDGEEMGGEGDVTLPQDLLGRGNVRSEQSAVKLSELGPRLRLSLVKIEGGVCDGEVLYHAYVHKSKSEVHSCRKKVKEMKRLREQRKREQESNVTRKKKEKELHKQRSLAGQQEVSVSDQSDSDNSDEEWYREEVGEAPDPALFGGSKLSKKHHAGAIHLPGAKRMKREAELPSSAPIPRRGILKRENDTRLGKKGAVQLKRRVHFRTSKTKTSVKKSAGKVFRKKSKARQFN